MLYLFNKLYGHRIIIINIDNEGREQENRKS